MTRPTVIALATALAAHAAVLYGVKLPPPEPARPKPDTYMEVVLYEPAPPAAEPPAPVIPPAETPPEPMAIPEPERPPEPEPEPPPPVVRPVPIIEPAPPPRPVPKMEKPKAPREKPAPPRDTPRTDVPAKPSPAPASGRTPGPAPVAPGYQNTGSVSYLSHGRAVYPPECLRNKQAGTVMLTLYINEFGSVDRVEVVRSSGFPAFDRAAAAAEKRSRFRPAVAGGRPVKSKARVPYTFQVK